MILNFSENSSNSYKKSSSLVKKNNKKNYIEFKQDNVDSKWTQSLRSYQDTKKEKNIEIENIMGLFRNSNLNEIEDTGPQYRYRNHSSNFEWNHKNDLITRKSIDLGHSECNFSNTFQSSIKNNITSQDSSPKLQNLNKSSFEKNIKNLIFNYKKFK